MSLFAVGNDRARDLTSRFAGFLRIVPLAVCLVTAMSAAPPAHASLTSSSHSFSPNERWLNRLYRDLLNRPADQAGLQTFMLALDSDGGTRRGVALTFLNSQELRTRLIGSMYHKYLGRDPDPDISAFLNMLAGGATVEQVRAAFISSPEYFSVHGGTNDGWITAVYHDILGRDAGAEERNALIGLLNQGHTTQEIGLMILMSQEAMTKLVNDAFAMFLGHPPTAERLNDALQFLSSHRDEEGLAQLLGSDEYFQHACDDAAFNPTQAFVMEAFKRLLNRKPGLPEVMSWSEQMNGGMSRKQFILTLEGSTEARVWFVRMTFYMLLHRDPDTKSIGDLVAFLNNGGTIEQLKANLMGSAEYFQVRANNDVDKWITALYKDVLNHGTNDKGRAAIKAMLSSGKSRGDVALYVEQSDEGLAVLVNSWYRQWLGRDATPAEANLLIGLLRNGKTDEQAVACIGGSENFFALAGTWVYRGKPFALVLLSFTDSNSGKTAASYKTRIDWGDGTSGDGMLTPNGDGWNLCGKHTYDKEGKYLVRAAASDGSTSYALSSACVYARDGRPIVLSMSPTSAPAGSPGMNVVLTGFGFGPSSIVNWKDSARPTQLLSTNQIQAAIPASDLASAGSFKVTVQNPGPWAASEPMPFQVIRTAPAGPKLKGITPRKCDVGATPLVELIGSGFTADMPVFWNGVKHDAAFVNDGLIKMQLTADDTAKPGTFPVSVAKPSTSSDTAQPFRVGHETAPSISAKLVGVTRINSEHVEAKFEIRNDGTGDAANVHPMKAILKAQSGEPLTTYTNLTGIPPVTLKPGETTTVTVGFGSNKLTPGLEVTIYLMGGYDPSKSFAGNGNVKLP